MTYQILFDVWEGNPTFDEQNAKENGVNAVIIRINDMNGGHHMDENFTTQWEEAKKFNLRMIYFVYNPWQKGKDNWDWLKSHLPKKADGTYDCPKKISLDIEVKKTGYSAKEYANQVADLIRLMRLEGFDPFIYTGSWFLGYLSYWPKDVDYWWARYPNSMSPRYNSWDELYEKVNELTWTPDLIGQKRYSPGPVKIWQISDKWVLPCTPKHAIDVNIWNGDYESLAAWWGNDIPEQIVEEKKYWYDGLSDTEKIQKLCELHKDDIV